MTSSRCPNCGYPTEAQTPLGEREAPGPLDWGVCLNCGRLLRYDVDPDGKGLSWRGATMKEEVLMDDENRERLNRAQVAIRERGVLR